MSFSRSEVYSFPFPPADYLEHLNQIVDNGAERVVALVERQSAHRIKQEDRVIANDMLLAKLGWLSATLITVIALAIAYEMVRRGQDLKGLATVISALVLMGGVYLGGSKIRADERKEKAELLAGRGAPPGQGS